MKISKENYDFSCWVIKYDRKSVNDLIYQKDCLKSEGELVVPLVWNYQDWKPESVLGHALLEHSDEGIYAYCKFNDSESGRVAKSLIMTDDLYLGPFVTEVKIDKGYVTHGKIRSVNLILDRVDRDDCYKPILNGADNKDKSYNDGYKKALDDIEKEFESWTATIENIRHGSAAFFTIRDIRIQIDQLREMKGIK